MRYHESTSAPRCSACGSRHYPATLGSGRRVWCDGSPADPRAEIRAGIEREQRERARATLLAERAARAESPPIESWEALRAPDSLPPEL